MQKQKKTYQNVISIDCYSNATEVQQTNTTVLFDDPSECDSHLTFNNKTIKSYSQKWSSSPQVYFIMHAKQFSNSNIDYYDMMCVYEKKIEQIFKSKSILD